MSFLLDTTVISDLLRHPEGAAAMAVDRVGEANVFTSIIVAAELRFGVAKRGSRRLAALVDGVLERIGITGLTAPADRLYAELRHHLQRRGTPIGSNDLLIAAHSLAMGSVLVTDNVREFSRVPGLTIENWLRP
jgi:tRNA(fMet)-specific endonuclease VapC